MSINATGGAALMELVPYLRPDVKWMPVRGPGMRLCGDDDRLAVTVVVDGDQYAAVVEEGSPLEPVGSVGDPEGVAARMGRMVTAGAAS